MKSRLRDIASGRRDALNIDPRLIKIQESWNPRNYALPENRLHLDQLKLSIAQVGVLSPLLVRWDGEQAVLVDGECRLRACLELIAEGVALKTVPVLQETASDDATRLVIALASNTGKPFSLMESGAAYKRLQRFGWTLDQIALKTGTTAERVAAAIELADAPTDVQGLVSAGAVSPALARQLVRAMGDKAGEELRGMIKTGTVVKRPKKAGKVALSRKAEAEQIAAERELGDDMALWILSSPETRAESQMHLAAKAWRKLRGSKHETD